MVVNKHVLYQENRNHCKYSFSESLSYEIRHIDISLLLFRNSFANKCTIFQNLALVYIIPSYNC